MVFRQELPTQGDKVKEDDPAFLSAQDDFPLWSAPFGLMLLDLIPLRAKIKVLDIGFGSGFPLLELAQRLGDSSTVFGIDPLKAAHERVQYKMNVLNIKNVQLVEGDASSMLFQDNTFDLIVSNLGINNFDDPQKVFTECFRVAKRGAQIVLTTNPKGHMDTFYSIFAKTLRELRMGDVMNDLAAHINHRLTRDKICDYLERSGFRITGTHQDSFRLRFLDGSAFFRHSLIRYGFLDDWKSLVPDQEQKKVFKKLEENLNHVSERKGELELTIPIAYVEGNK
ncbi:MAG: methyltransferase domain-containing protein [Candidatus Aminicenantes bacterium]|nr:methyltransferase domain-containing protein [Candidatus Aminicenantes bacterium]